jgi:hypothetical protein
MTKSVYIYFILCLTGALAIKFASFVDRPQSDLLPGAASFEINGNNFEKDGKPFTVVSGIALLQIQSNFRCYALL